jgi:hypothetical protein
MHPVDVLRALAYLVILSYLSMRMPIEHVCYFDILASLFPLVVMLVFFLDRSSHHSPNSASKMDLDQLV